MTIELTLLSRVAYRDVEITGPRLRGLLALLAGGLPTGCGTARLVAGLWPDTRPENPTKALQVLIFRARAQLGPDVIASTPTGYRLALTEEQVDSSEVLLAESAAARHARAGDHAAALARAETGLAVWDGSGACDGAPDDPLAALRADLLCVHRALRRARALALSRLGRAAEAVEPLIEVVRERPRDEEALLELLRCEADTAGPAAALARYDAYRRALREELGTDPGPTLRAVYQELLRGAAPIVRHGIPHEPNPLLGRDADIEAVAALLRTSRVTSIVGPGGLGKTRLAYALGRRAEQRIVYFVELAGVTSDDNVAAEVATALGVGESRRLPAGPLVIAADARSANLVGGIVEAVGAGPVLLVLDNCEHVIRGAADLVRALVATTRDLRVLTTGRAPLGLSSESVYLLPELSPSATAALFEQRARAARPGVELPAEAVAELCRRLEGLPLAAELAAARVRVMSVAEITRRLADRFTLLRGTARDAPRRHRTLHAVVDWSWNLLDPAGRAAMRGLSVFPGGFTADTAQHVLDAGDAGDAPGTDSLSVLEHLVDQSLLKVTDTPTGTRFRMLETVREFAAAHREAAGETDRALGRFRAWARDFGVARHASVFGAEPFAAAQSIRAEQDNLLHALRQSLALGDGAGVAATGAVLASLWTTEANYARMVVLGRETGWVLSHFRPEDEADPDPDLVEVTRAVAALCVANALAVQGPRAERLLVTLHRLPPAPPSNLIRAGAIVLRAATRVPGPHRPGIAALCDADEPLVAGLANGVLSYALEQRNDPLGALTAAERMLAFVERERSPWIRILAHARIGDLCLQIERGDRARRHLRAALETLDELGPPADVWGIHWAMALAGLQLGAVDEAEYWLDLAAPEQVVEGEGTYVFDLGMRAEIALARGSVDTGLRLWRRACHPPRGAQDPIFRSDPPGLEPWTLEVEAVAVIAHVRHGRLDLVEEIADELPRKAATLLGNAVGALPAYVMDLPLGGTLLLALAVVDLNRAARTGGGPASTSAARMIALAERCHFLRGFQPTMSGARARETAERADGAAYADAVSAYAALGPDELRAAVSAALRARIPR